MDLNRGLPVGGCRKDLTLFRRNRRIALDNLRADAAERLKAERKRGNVEQKQPLDVAAEHAALNSRADRHALIRVDALERILAAECLDSFLNGRNTRGAADQQHLVDIGNLQP